MHGFFSIDFLVVITWLMLGTSVFYLIERFYFSRLRPNGVEASGFFSGVAGFFPPLFAVWILRAFILQLFIVPTGSLEPTVKPIEFIAITQYAYGLRVPILNKKILHVGTPQIGDIAVFRWPVDPKVIFTKRVVGLPGDRLAYKDKMFYRNGIAMPQTFIRETRDPETQEPVFEKTENLNGIVHRIYLHPQRSDQAWEVTVPAGQYFMMGDNRDSSTDSRVWGFVPDELLIGKGVRLVVGWNRTDPWWDLRHKIRWDRIGRRIDFE